MRKDYTQNAKRVIENAKKQAASLGHGYVGTEHLLLALIEVKGVASEVLKENGVVYDKILELVEDHLAASGGVMIAEMGEYTPRAKRVIESACEEAERLGNTGAGTEHLLLALLKDSDSIGVRLLNTKGINVQKIYIDVLTAVGQDSTSAKNEYLMQKSKKQKSTKQEKQKA